MVPAAWPIARKSVERKLDVAFDIYPTAADARQSF